MMTISEDGRTSGYVSGGCVDADIVFQAIEAIRDNLPRQLVYGVGSPFKDLSLPCGGSIEVCLFPGLDATLIQSLLADLKDRRACSVGLNGDLTLEQLPSTETIRDNADLRVFSFAPKLRLRIVGRGQDIIALALLARSSGYDCSVASPVDDEITQLEVIEGVHVEKLSTPRAYCPTIEDDPWTAFVMSFHDLDWESELLGSALESSAFYVGAVGSRRTHQRRLEALKHTGVSQSDRLRVRGPIGLVPSMRDASTLAISILAEIVGAYQDQITARFSNTALILLAAGAGKRFEDGDKLMAHLKGEPVLAGAGNTLRREIVGARIAVVGPQHNERRAFLEDLGWTVIENSDPSLGQGSSLATGIKAVAQFPQIENVAVLLGDMPFVDDAHLRRLKSTLDKGGTDAVITGHGQLISPPSMFRRSVFDILEKAQGDMGARPLLDQMGKVVIVEASSSTMLDIDRQSDLLVAERMGQFQK